MIKHTRCLFLGTVEDTPYITRLKKLVGGMTCVVVSAPISTWAEVKHMCQKRDITCVFSTSLTLLKKLTFLESGSPSIDNYAGSLFERDGIEILFIDPLAQLVSLPYGEFLTGHFLTKLHAPELWLDTQIPALAAFNYSLYEPGNAEETYNKFSMAWLLACDIETIKTPLSITCIGFTAIFPDFTTASYVIPLEDMYAYIWIRKFLELPAAKIFQNGKYDVSYLSRFDLVPHNYLWDTATYFHCLFSELPKDLGFLQAFFVRKAQYWKDLADSGNRADYYLYNAKDTWGTALAFLGMMLTAPTYAKNNYLQEFPTVFPCHLSEMTGIKHDAEMCASQETKYNSLIKTQTAELAVMAATPGFNSNSHVQVKKLMEICGSKDLASSSDEKTLNKFAFRHPLNAVLADKILEIRGNRKLVSTYLDQEKTFHGRILYSLNPHGTDTGRLASKEHHFWTGLNIQNIPRGSEVKCTLVADTDFILYECDLEQAESRDTAHIAGDESLIAAVSGTKDFHSVNAAAFFGRTYESIYDQSTRKTIDKVLRDLAKRVNHGANYLMGPDVLVDTMGLINIYKAAAALRMPKFWSPKQIAENLLERFHKTYPFLGQVFYPGVVKEVMSTGFLASQATHSVPYQATNKGWTRRCFQDPQKNKRAKNAYVAHGPQSLNAMTLNKAYMKVFYELAIHPEHYNNFRLHAQVHDSILFSVRKGHEELAERVKAAMEIPVTIKGYDEKIRTFTVPAALSEGGYRWSDTK